MRYIFLNEKFCILIRFSLKFVPTGLFDNMSTLVQVMTWCLAGDKPLTEAMMTQLTDAYMRHKGDELNHEIHPINLHTGKGMRFFLRMLCIQSIVSIVYVYTETILTVC